MQHEHETACTESRSSAGLAFPLSIMEMISPTSMIVTASASTIVPKGSPTHPKCHDFGVMYRGDHAA
jgi:hypothetical protein